MIQDIYTERAPEPIGPYSQGIILGNQLIFISGQGAIDPITNQLASENIKGQTRQVIRNIEEILKEGGSKLKNVLKVTIFLKGLDDYADMNEVYRDMFSLPYPSRTTVQAELLNGLLIEVDVIATFRD